MQTAATLFDLLQKLAEEHGIDSLDFRTNMLDVLRAAYNKSRKTAEAHLIDTGKGTECARHLSNFQDALITGLFDFVSQHVYAASNPSSSERLSVVAVGGYGRGTLAPGSDIDLMFLMPYKQTAWGESVVEYMLYALWDLGFKVGHSTRSIDECIRLARRDGTVLTSVLEARLICGDNQLYAELEQRFRSDIVGQNTKDFIKDKLAERDARHHKAGESRYLVEPDVKDGKGGMRDLHTLFWIARYVYGTRSPAELTKAGVFSRSEQNSFMRCENFLWAVRCHMHFMARRGDDRLSFDIQSELAERLGYTAHGGLKRVERFMKHYFLVAKEVGDLTRIFCSVLETQHIKRAPRMSKLMRRLIGRSGSLKESADFYIETGRLKAVNDKVFIDDPVNLLRVFALAVKRNVTIHPDTLKRIRRSGRLFKDNLRNNKQANKLFIDILTSTRDPEVTLRRMNEAGVLGKFIPDFGRIVAMMQFNMYHHYTVDEHLIRALGILASIEKGALKNDHPLASEIITTMPSRRALYVAVLLHDIAKGRPEDHSIAGEKVARNLCPRLGLTPDETELVAWLVRNHLVMSETAQMRDLNDFKTILDFTAIVQSPERLKLLLVLTVVDIRAVGPNVWNGWKGQLLRTLYFEAEPVLSGGHSRISRTQRIEASQDAFLQAMGETDQAIAHSFMKRHYDNYWLNADTSQQLAHAKLLHQAEQAGKNIATKYSSDVFTAMTELSVLAADHPRLLALLTGACAAAQANIVGAKIFTTNDGMALDILLLQRAFPQEADEALRMQRVSELISKVLHGTVRLRDILAGRNKAKDRFKAFSIKPRAIIDNKSSNVHTVIEVNGLDRIGLLYDLTEALYRLNLNIASAHITTFGERVVDVFYVTDLTGAKITNANRRSTIIRHLIRALDPSDGVAVKTKA